MSVKKSSSGFKPRSTAVVTRFLYRMFSGAGLDADLIFERCGIDTTNFSDTKHRISHEKLLHMWEVAGELSNDPDFALHLAAEVPMAPFNAAGYLAMTSKNLRETLSSLQKYIKIFTDDGSVTVIENDELTRVSIDLSGGFPPNRQHTDFWQVYFYRNFNSTIGWDVPLAEVGFRHKKPADTQAYEEIFNCKITFGQKENYVLFPSVYLDYQTINSDSAMHKVHEMQAIQHLHALTEVGILNKVKRTIFESLPAKDIELKHVAKLLNLTPRTVQRNLASEGTTFKQLVDEARKDYTLVEMRNTEFSVSEVAFRLGYRDLSSFYRAFKRWTGTTPVEYRESFNTDNRSPP